MEKGISEIVGHADLDEGRTTEVYRALRSLLCATCGTWITEGTLFTRRKVKGIGLRIMPQCPKCAPFTLRIERKEKSSLLQSLLAERPSDSSRQTVSSEAEAEAQEKAKSVNEEVRRRLGPALKRGRHGRK
jgi:RNase P subunit RPR2